MMWWRKLWQCVINAFRSRKSAADIETKDAQADRIIAQVKRETEKLNDRIESIMRELISEVRGR